MTNMIEEVKSLNLLICKYLHEKTKENNLSKYPSPLQLGIAKYLYEKQEDTVYQKDLQEFFHISKAAISEGIQSMEKKGLIQRIPSKMDARKNKIELTEMGKESLMEMERIKEEANKEILKELKKEEIESFIKTIHKIKEIIEKRDINV
ncbi:MAG: MarR family transcriptional regulator [Bacilli bacterium]|nr:MarR family transcriptional regulator [Bacilli bacterium]